MTLRYKFVLPINLILIFVLTASLAWEWRRQEATGQERLHGPARRGGPFRPRRLSHVRADRPFRRVPAQASATRSTREVSPEHQVALVDASGRVIAHAAEHARHPMDPARLAARGGGFWMTRQAGETFLVRVVGGRRPAGRCRRVRPESRLRRGPGEPLEPCRLVSGAGGLAAGRRQRRDAPGGASSGAAVGAGGSPDGARPARGPGRRASTATSWGRWATGSTPCRGRWPSRPRRTGGRWRRPGGSRPICCRRPRLRVGCLDVAGRCEAAGPVGGDLYDVQPLPGDRVAVLVVDVSGHDVAAALHTAMIRAIVWHEAESAATPGEVLARLNARGSAATCPRSTSPPPSSAGSILSRAGSTTPMRGTRRPCCGPRTVARESWRRPVRC